MKRAWIMATAALMLTAGLAGCQKKEVKPGGRKGYDTGEER